MNKLIKVECRQPRERTISLPLPSPKISSPFSKTKQTDCSTSYLWPHPYYSWLLFSCYAQGATDFYGFLQESMELPWVWGKDTLGKRHNCYFAIIFAIFPWRNFLLTFRKMLTIIIESTYLYYCMVVRPNEFRYFLPDLRSVKLFCRIATKQGRAFNWIWIPDK